CTMKGRPKVRLFPPRRNGSQDLRRKERPMVRPTIQIATVITALVAARPASAQRPGFSLESLLAPPFAEGLVASSSGTTVAWVHDLKGVRNVWVAAAPEYQGRQLTQFAKDDGQEIGELELTPDGSAVWFVRGGAPNRRGDIPNPTSDPA